MEAQDPLSELADIHLPAEVAFWPPAAGWWILALVLLVALVLGARLLLQALARRRKKAAALGELEAAWQRYQEQAEFHTLRNQAGLDFLREVNSVLRRVALLHYPQEQVAPLHGDAWLTFLDSRDADSQFSRGAGQALGDGVYRQRFAADAQALYRLARQWIQRRYARQPLLQRGQKRRSVTEVSA